MSGCTFISGAQAARSLQAPWALVQRCARPGAGPQGFRGTSRRSTATTPVPLHRASQAGRSPNSRERKS